MHLFAIALMMIPNPDQVGRKDLAFRYAVEEFVMLANPSHQIPQPYRGMIEGLTADHYKARNEAHARLQIAIGADDRWLMWGRKYRDAEIAYRCNKILQRIHPCWACRGRGACDVFVGARGNEDNQYGEFCRRCHRSQWQHSPEQLSACEACGGNGTDWPLGAFE